MLDDLLQLGKLEDYRQRAGDARLGVEDVKSNVEGNSTASNHRSRPRRTKTPTRSSPV